MRLIKNFKYEIKKSKFIAYYYELNGNDNVKDIINNIKLENKKANHVVYAYKYNNTGGKSDDKEPSNSAGLPIYRLLEYKNINNGLVVIVRYFGGTKLGIGLLTRTYSYCANEVLKD